MSYFPFMIDIRDKNCLIVGGGRVAYRKALDLLQFGANVTIISEEVCSELMENSQVNILQKEYEKADICNRFLVIAATDHEEVNRRVSEDCNNNNILVNVVDVKDACSFIFPAIVKKDDLVVSISTGGNSPAGAAYLKEKIEKSIPPYYEKNLELLGSVRGLVMDRITDISKRRELYYNLLKKADEEERELCREDVLSFINAAENGIH